MDDIAEIHSVPEDISASRLQEYGVGIFQYCPTKSALKKALKKAYIKVDGVTANSATWIKGGEKLELIVPGGTGSSKELKIDLPVLYEDEHLAAVYKPPGIPVSGNKFRTVANALPHHLKPTSQPDATIPQPVHRLDYATSGVLLTGKTQSSIRALNQLFEERGIRKTYTAICQGEIASKGVINEPVDGKPACSSFKVTRSLVSERFGRLNLLHLEPETGRRHQLRKHLAGLGTPILGDLLYGIEGNILQGKGLYLHATAIAFVHPFTGEQLKITAALPKKFLKLFPLED
jgi:23S rRNA pseudouridine1911/1915/1917 synthase